MIYFKGRVRENHTQIETEGDKEIAMQREKEKKEIQRDRKKKK